MVKPRVRLIHFGSAEAPHSVDILRKVGFQVECAPEWRVGLLKEWKADPPDAFVIDLTRLPSHGREVAIDLRRSLKTRHVPLVFCGGAADKAEKVRSLLPDATYCGAGELVETVRRTLENPGQIRAIPAGMMDRYQGRSIAQKLGIRAGTAVSLVDPPRDAAEVLGPLPTGAAMSEDGRPGSVTLVFVHQPGEIAPVLTRVRAIAGQTKLWVLWRKKTAPGHTGVTENLIRECALSLGLVDYKVCSVSPVWSALALAERKI